MNTLTAPPNTQAQGIYQADIIIRSAIIAGIADLRANPYLLDFAFAGLLQDDLTKSDYGQQEINQAKKYFQNTDIRVALNINPNEVKFPVISIALMASSDDDTTLGDIHYQTSENNDTTWDTLAGPMSATAYNPATGELTINPKELSTFILAPNMIVLDKNGRQYTITDVTDYNVIVIDKNINADLTGLLIKPTRPALITQLESIVFKESFAIGVHVDSEPVHLTYLHSILTFILLRYKQALFETRGLERTSLSSAEFRRDDDLMPEMVYSRYISLSGYVRQYWPKLTTPKITDVAFEPTIQPTIQPETVSELELLLDTDGFSSSSGS